MLLHNHDSDDGDVLVLHINREEAVALVKAISTALDESPDGDNFSVNLGITSHLHGVDDDEEIAG